MENTFKTLWSTKNEQYVHFDMSPLTDEVIWGYSDMPQLMGKETTIDLLLAYLGKEVNMPEGTELRTIKLEFQEEPKPETAINE
jgi:hypothetical protein